MIPSVLLNVQLYATFVVRNGLSVSNENTRLTCDTMQAPIIALKADLSTPVPIYVSGALFVAFGFIALLLPFEPRGKASI